MMNQAMLKGLMSELEQIKTASMLAGIGGALKGGAGALGRAAQLVPHVGTGGLGGLAKMVPGAVKSTAQAGYQAAKAAPTLGNKLLGGGAVAAGGLAAGMGAKKLFGGGGQQQ